MKQTGEILTFNAVANPALNAFSSIAMQTGLVAGGDDGLLLLGAQFEYNVAIDGNGTRETALVRGLKSVMPTILDDDVMVKQTTRSALVTSGLTLMDLAPFVPLPPQAIIVVESNMYLNFKTTGQTTIMTCNCLVWCERVKLTPQEKNSILSARLNNLLN